MRDMTNKAENDKSYFENNLTSASKIIEDLENKVLQLSNINDKLRLDLDGKLIDAERLKNEIEIWRSKFNMLDSRYQREMSTKGKQFENDVLVVIEKFNSEKGHYEETIRSLLQEIDAMKSHPNYSYKITMLVRDLEDKMKSLMEVSERLQQIVKDSQEPRDSPGSIRNSATPERFKSSAIRVENGSSNYTRKRFEQPGLNDSGSRTPERFVSSRVRQSASVLYQGSPTSEKAE